MRNAALPGYVEGTFITSNQTDQNKRTVVIAGPALRDRLMIGNALNRMAKYALHAGWVAAAVFVLVASAGRAVAAESPLIEQSADGLVTLNIFGVPLHFTKDDLNSLDIVSFSCDVITGSINEALVNPEVQDCFRSRLDELQHASVPVHIWGSARFFPNRFNSPTKPQPFLGFIDRDSVPTGPASAISITIAAVGTRLSGGRCNPVCPGFAYAGLVSGFAEYKTENPSPFDTQHDASLFVIPTADFRDGRPISKIVFCKAEVVPPRVCSIYADSDDSRVSIGLSWYEKNAGLERWPSLFGDFKQMVDFILPSYKGRMK